MNMVERASRWIWKTRFRLGRRPSNTDTEKLYILNRRLLQLIWDPGCLSHCQITPLPTPPFSWTYANHIFLHWDTYLESYSKWWDNFPFPSCLARLKHWQAVSCLLSEGSLQIAARIKVRTAGSVYASNSFKHTHHTWLALFPPATWHMTSSLFENRSCKSCHMTGTFHWTTESQTGQAPGYTQHTPDRLTWSAHQHCSKTGFIKNMDNLLYWNTF